MKRRRRASHLGRLTLWNNGRRATQLGRPSENRFTLESCWRAFFLVLQFALRCRQATPPSFVEQDATTAEKAIIRLLLRIFARETCFFSKAKWGGWSSMWGVGNERRTASGGCQVISVPFFEGSGYWVQCMILLLFQSLQSLGKSRFVSGNYRQETGMPS